MTKNRVLAVIGLALLAATPAAAQPAQIGIEQFERWIFQNSNAEQARMTFASKIELEITRIEQATTLLEAQKERIRLAGQGDLKRFYDRVEKVRREFRAMEQGLNQNNVNEVHQLTLPLQAEVRRGLFGPGSLLQKVVAATLDEQQLEIMRLEAERQQKLKMENAVMVYLTQLGRLIPMTAAQRQALLDLALANMKSFNVDDRYANYLVRYRLSMIPIAEFEPIFDEAQLTSLQKNLQQGQALKQMLQQQGALIDD